ncbi:biotin--[acetyl-CoA-carboxylase] ligase [Marinactinospora thermotolerans]|uniref:biotin--[biotin carboxyl-carrier protein] ligase n=1 Tax=Marinactinospora thermotolerans DSM 45154 TaxID=1122192 RepID=A0A1T4QQ89_9ACTN|nr:biotin--[acetyl-CoA-carboxylase] ligase [Marinactinospora thermotolerans]SKA05428.1 BirA family transcriptional regulator, biotin operon repressor / biotin-[acetyl-CoA-carboxylase] ligase [Marinactinospora thermotolerans DSM 45154]
MSADSSPYTDLGRPPLRDSGLRRALVRPGGLWREIEVVAETGSTNTDLVARAHAGAPEGSVLVTEHQTAGRGRLDRVFTTPPRAALTFSVLVRPRVSAARYGWLSLLMGVAAAGAVARVAEVDVGLKWPNDLLATGGEERKLAGILAEVAPSTTDSAVVIGMGLNVAQSRAELPVPTATSLAVEEAACVDRDPLLRAVLRGFADRYRAWLERDGDAEASGLAAEYRARCVTIGRQVRVHLPGERILEGTATGIDADGRLTVAAGDGTVTSLSAGDVVHVRPSTGRAGTTP